MPAHMPKDKKKENNYFHILNRSFSGESLFKDKEDYEIFLNYLEDYLGPPAHPDTYIKEFSINGKTYKGMTHRNKNYFDDVDLLAYDLKPDHFHLVLHQKSDGSVEKLMRSLSTRFSIYYNKKYNRSGKLFEGPYKSINFSNSTPLLLLTHYLHSNLENDLYKTDNIYSSYENYLGKKEALWVKPNLILSLYDELKQSNYKKLSTYQQFIEKYKLTEKEEKELERITLDKKLRHLARSNPPLESSTPSKDFRPSGSPGTTYAMLSSALFVVLFSIGLNNVMTTSAKSEPTQVIVSETQTPTVFGEKTEEMEKKEDPAKELVKVVVADKETNVNIRKEPDISSEVVGKAENDQVFEFVSIISDWYGVRLDNKEVGYIHSNYIETYNNE